MAKRDEKIFVKPGEGRMPRHLFSGRRILADGEWVPNAPAFQRLLLNGDLKRATPPRKKTGKPTPKKSVETNKPEDEPDKD